MQRTWEATNEAATAAVDAERNPGDRPPNVILILVDDLGWGELGCYGNSFNETPHIDALAADGLRFSNAYASAPVCSPSRAAILTGQAPPRNGITDYLRPEAEWHLPFQPGAFDDNELPDDTEYRIDPTMTTLAQVCRERSYATGIVGKWHLSGYDDGGVKFGPDRYGFDEVIVSEQVGIGEGSYFWPYDHVDPAIEPLDGEDEYLVDRMNAEAVDFIRRYAAGPFFLYLSHYAVHTALAGKPDDVRHFAAKAGLPVDDDHRWASHDNPVLAAMLRSVDDGVGMIRATLAELGIDRDTLVVFTSDNGGEARVTQNGQLRGGKSMTYEGGLRVPLLICQPGVVPTDSDCDIPTINTDFYPTIAELTGFDVPDHHVLDGVSILPLLTGPSGPADLPPALLDRSLFWHYPLDAPHFLGGRSSAAHRAGDWKLISFFDDGGEELYDLRADRSEAVDRHDAEPECTRRLASDLRLWLNTVGAVVPQWVEKAPADRHPARGSGYDGSPAPGPGRTPS